MNADSEQETDLPIPGAAAAADGFADGPASPHFTPLPITGNRTWGELEAEQLSAELLGNLRFAPRGSGVGWGMPFTIGNVILVKNETVEVRWPSVRTPWLVFMHTTDTAEARRDAAGFIPATTGPGLLRGHVADYVLLFGDGTEERFPIFRQQHVGMVTRPWGVNCFEAVSYRKPHPLRTLTEQPAAGLDWGHSQFRVAQPDMLPWMNWLCAWENPHPDKELCGLRIEPGEGTLLLSAVTAGRTRSFPLRWDGRRKAVLRLPDGTRFDPSLSAEGLCRHVRLDLGQVISVRPRLIYPADTWERTSNNQPPGESCGEVLIEYTAHPEACLHLEDGTRIPVAEVERSDSGRLVAVKRATRRVRLRAVDGSSRRPVAVKLHVHGEAGEYLPPVDRHRIPNALWYEDLSVDYVNAGAHFCSYIPGETTIDLPLGTVYIEISKGFEIEPIRRIVDVGETTEELEFRLDRVLPWRERGWVTADTHVHFLSPTTALLEGAGEGVNVVNLLASQWGELMTNAGDFDGHTTHGSRESGGEGEYLVRVGTENRQHVLGHISLLGYQGQIIAPMTTGGPDESALGDPVEILLTEWARKCRAQGGIVVVPHFPRPRAEHSVAIVGGDVDGVEMTSWTDLYGGIDI